MRILRITLLLTITISALGQSGLKGHVIDNDKYPFAGLKIEIIDKGSVVALAFTDQHGDYVLNNVKPGLYNIRIQHLGFRERIIENISIPNNEIKELDIVHPGPCVESIKVCPNGHTDNLIPIVYGLPDGKLIKKAEKGLVKLGGCIVSDCDPKWYCKKHENEF